jgi:hypothetical protein
MKYPPVTLSRTDLKKCIALLTAYATHVDRTCRSASELDKGRQCRQIIKKLNKKLEL